MNERRVISADGTDIAYECLGDGPPVVLVGGGLDDGSENAVLLPALADRFCVHNYARRGRAASGDTPPYAVERELEDLTAVIEAAGGPVHLFGASTGGALALEAAAAGLPVRRLAVYEVPYNVAQEWPAKWHAYVSSVTVAAAEERYDDALALFMAVTGTPEEVLAQLRTSPYWPNMVALAPTLPYDAACLGNGQPPADRLARVAQPTLVMTGNGADQAEAAEWVQALPAAADAIADTVQDGHRRSLGAGHAVEAEVLAPALAEFFDGRSPQSDAAR